MKLNKNNQPLMTVSSVTSQRKNPVVRWTNTDIYKLNKVIMVMLKKDY